MGSQSERDGIGWQTVCYFLCVLPAAFVGLFVTGYKFWGQPPEAADGLDGYAFICLAILVGLQFNKYSRVASWWLLPIMGGLTFVLFEPSPNYGELHFQAGIAVAMSVFALCLLKTESRA